MTGSERADDRILGSLRTADGKGVVRMEDRFDTDIDDVWSALTDPLRLFRWIGEVGGDLRLNGEYRYHFFSSGAVRDTTSLLARSMARSPRGRRSGRHQRRPRSGTGR